MTAECFLCGEPAVERFGNGWLCEGCIPAETADPSDDPTETGGENPSDSFSNETESAGCDGAADFASGSDGARNTDNTGYTACAVPEIFDQFGEIAVPIPPREKAADRPRTEEHLYAPDDDVLEAYIEAGHNYGLACQNGLAVLDADEPDALAPVIDALPETVWQVSGSGEGEHYFLRVPGLDDDLPLDDPETGENIGHIKAAAQSYVVGPGSVHPSGNRYGPLQGKAIATVAEDELREIIEPFHPEPKGAGHSENPGGASTTAGEGFDDARLSVCDVLSAGSYPEGRRVEHPSHGSETGANFMADDGGETWRCWRHDCTGNALHLVGIEQDIISCGEWDPSSLDSETWREIFEAAREAGYDLPEWEPAPDPVPVLPNLREWNWRGAGRPDDHLTIDEARERCQNRLEDAIGTYASQVLIEALPTLGKSRGTTAAVAATDEPTTIFTGRGREEQYEQIREWCLEEGIPREDVKILPSFTRDCDCANGEHGDDWQERVMDWYRRGATPQDIHKHAERELGRPLPCHAGDRTCPYTAKWNFDPDDYQALIGHYVHAHNDKITQRQTVVFDEFPSGAYETSLDHATLPGAVSYFLQCHDGLPFDNFTDLIENRDDERRRADALLWFEDPQRDSLQAITNTAGHAAAPLVTFTLLAGDDLANGWERADLADGTGLYDRANGGVHLLRPPDLQYTSGVVALDGTPTKEMWEQALGIYLTPRQVLTDGERRDYLRDVLELQLVRTTDAVKSYSPKRTEIDKRVSLREDAALLEAIAEDHGQKPALITTNRAEHLYRNEGLLDLVDDHQHYGNILGSNRFGQTRLGAVIGSRNFGPTYVKKWGAYLGEAIEPTFPSPDNDFAPTEYGEVGNKIRTHMRDHETLQAAMRFGRDGNGATVYVHTDTLPDWVPIAGEGRVLKTWSDGMKQVIEAARDLDEWTTAELAAHHAVDIGERQVRDHLYTLADRGVVDAEIDGCGFVWRDDGLHRVADHGEVELVDPGSLSAAESAELARTSSYRWEFRTSSASTTPAGASAGYSGDAADRQAANGGEPPPDDPA